MRDGSVIEVRLRLCFDVDMDTLLRSRLDLELSVLDRRHSLLRMDRSKRLTVCHLLAEGRRNVAWSRYSGYRDSQYWL